MARRRSVGAGMVIPLLLAAGACGKKGPPLAPFARIPAAVETIAARRVGHDVYVTVTVPARNIDESVPPSVERVEVYGYTGAAPPPRGRFLDGGTTVAVFEVASPPPPDQPAAAADGRPAPGATFTVMDALTADELSATPAQAPPAAAVPRRFYMAIAFSERGVPGPQGAVVEVPLAPPPDPPRDLRASYTEQAITLSWEPPGGLVAFLLDRALPVEPPPPGIEAIPQPPRPPVPEGPLAYNVYVEVAPDPLVLPPQDDGPSVAAPVPLNRTPVAAGMFTQPVPMDERERCYTVRAVRGAGPAAVESDPSPRRCVTPIDIFPPAMPAKLAAIASADAITLIWDSNAEPDLAGYVVLRGEAGSDTLAPLTPEPILEVQFTDDTVTPGARYVYHVVAVDGRIPLANTSAPAMIEATAR